MLSTNNLRQKKKERACADLENCFVKARRDITVGAVEAYGTAVFYDQGRTPPKDSDILIARGKEVQVEYEEDDSYTVWIPHQFDRWDVPQSFEIPKQWFVNSS